MGRTRWLVPVLSAAMLAAAGSFAMVSPAKAECPEAPWFPPVTEAVRSAREVIIGKVIASDQDGRFRLRIDYVLRGSSRVGEVRAFTRFRPKWPGSLCTFLNPSVDDTIAIAFDALTRDGRTRYNAASWIYGMPEWMIDVERTSLDELWYLGSLPRTDSLSVDDSDGTTAPQPARALILLLVFMVSTLALARLLDRRDRGTS